MDYLNGIVAFLAFVLEACKGCKSPCDILINRLEDDIALLDGISEVG